MEYNEDGVPEVDMPTMIEWVRGYVAVTYGISLTEEAIIAVLEGENHYIFHEKGIDGDE